MVHKLYEEVAAEAANNRHPTDHMISCPAFNCNSCPFCVDAEELRCALDVLDLRDERPLVDLLRAESTWRLWMELEGFTPKNKWKEADGKKEEGQGSGAGAEEAARAPSGNEDPAD